MQAVEFTTELGDRPMVTIPDEVWRSGACGQFAREDSSEDAVYDSYR
jgi:hypothetical protein